MAAAGTLGYLVWQFLFPSKIEVEFVSFFIGEHEKPEVPPRPWADADRTAFASAQEIVCEAGRFRWRGLGRADARPGSHSSAVIERLNGRRVEQIARHRQCHHGVEDLVGLLAAAGLVAEMVVGQSTGCRLHRGADQLRDTKTVFVASGSSSRWLRR